VLASAGSAAQVKASGGVRTFKEALAMLAAGCHQPKHH